MSSPKRTVLITGCSEGGLGAALAIAFHEAGLRVYATARNPAKMEQLTARGIETLTLNVQSDSSIAACVGKLSSLDILVNNAGATFLMPVVDVSIAEAKKTFELNVWSYIAVTQAFMPLLLESKRHDCEPDLGRRCDHLTVSSRIQRLKSSPHHVLRHAPA